MLLGPAWQSVDQAHSGCLLLIAGSTRSHSSPHQILLFDLQDQAGRSWSNPSRVDTVWFGGRHGVGEALQVRHPWRRRRGGAFPCSSLRYASLVFRLVSFLPSVRLSSLLCASPPFSLLNEIDGVTRTQNWVTEIFHFVRVWCHACLPVPSDFSNPFSYSIESSLDLECELVFAQLPNQFCRGTRRGSSPSRELSLGSLPSSPRRLYVSLSPRPEAWALCQLPEPF